jgi:hypothetical protein
MKKIPTLFVREFDGHKIVNITPEFTSDVCAEAFLHGVATVKIDGSCCAIINGEFYKRYDAKAGKPIPDGAIPCQNEPDAVTGHLPCWVKCDRENKSDKWFWVAYDKAFECVEPIDGTYEAIGKHFNGNPYNLDYDILERHGIRIVSPLDRTFDSVKQWLEAHDAEGLVFWLKGEPICKIKRSDFGMKWNNKR